MEPIKLDIKRFTTGQTDVLDDFVLRSYNGTFVSTRKFLEYHPKGRFEDHSLLFYKNDVLIAVVPACEVIEDRKKIFFSHKGSTFGGIIVNRLYFSSNYLQQIISSLDEYLRKENFHKIILKQPLGIFSRGSVATLDYLLGINGYQDQKDLIFAVDFSGFRTPDPKLRYSLYRTNVFQQVTQAERYNLNIRQANSEKDIRFFHKLLVDNLARHKTQPVHSPEELIDLRKRFPHQINFYACYKDSSLIIGAAMIWIYNDRLLHLQNICIDYQHQNLRPANLINDHLIKKAFQENMIFSFGSSTEEGGRRLNFGLAYFKEGFGAQGHLKYNFVKELS